mgnify:CR=1 FL=1
MIAQEHRKRIYNTDVWFFYGAASGKGKDQNATYHKHVLDYIVKYYRNKLREQGRTLTRVLLFTDGCPGQYDGKETFNHEAGFPQHHCGVEIVHAKSQKGDGKGVHDGLGKQPHKRVYNAVMEKRVTLNYASDYVTVAKQIASGLPNKCACLRSHRIQYFVDKSHHSIYKYYILQHHVHPCNIIT